MHCRVSVHIDVEWIEVFFQKLADQIIMSFVTGPVQRSVTTDLSGILWLLEGIVAFILVALVFVLVHFVVV